MNPQTPYDLTRITLVARSLSAARMTGSTDANRNRKLPDTVSEEGIREALSAFAPAEKIKLVKESGTPSVLIEMDMTRVQAEVLAKRMHGRSYEGRELRAWVPAMDW